MQRDATASRYNYLLNRIDEFILMNAHLPFGIPELADECCIAANHLSDVFRSIRKTSLGEYLAAKKLERAATLYYYTGFNLSEVADSTGFATKHSLSKAFSNHFNMSPGRLKKSSLYRPHSPNIIMDGIRSSTGYDDLMQAEFDYSIEMKVYQESFLIGKSVPLIANGLHNEIPYRAYLHQLSGPHNQMANNEIVVCPLDSINFGGDHLFRMICGEIVSGSDYDKLKKDHPDSILVPIPSGQYVSFEVQKNAIPAFEHEITYYRENIIGRQKNFTLKEFFAFYTYSIITRKHRYLVYLG